MTLNKKECIFNAAHQILGKRGFHGLSIAEVASKANVATGTIYRYFTDKDDLIRQLHQHTIISCIPQVMAGVNCNDISFSQYRQLWRNIQAIFINEPNALKCKMQYDSSPLAAELERNPAIALAWQELDLFFERGVARNIFIDLPIRALQVLSLDTVFHLTLQSQVHQLSLSESQLEAAILASWNAILVNPIPIQGAHS